MNRVTVAVLGLFAAVLSPPAAAIIMSQTDTVVTTLFATCLFGLLSSFYMPSTQSAVRSGG